VTLAALVTIGAGLALLQLPALPPWLLELPHVLPGPLLLAAALGGPRAAMVVFVLCRVVAAAGEGLAAVLPDELARADMLVTGTVDDFPRALPGRLQFPLTVESGDSRAPRLRRVLVSWYDPPPRVPVPGERWQLLLRVKPPRGLANPGGFDYERWLFAQRFDATGYVRLDGRNVPAPVAGGGPGWLLRARTAIAAGITAAVADDPALPYLVGLSVGVYQALPEIEWERLRLTGTIHLVSISGFHLTLVAVPLVLLGTAVGAALAARGVAIAPRLAGAAAAVAGAVVYGGLAGYPVPTLRSLLMIVTVAVLLLARRARPASDALALAALGAVALEPLGLLTPGFWMSFGGVAALVGAFQGLVREAPTGMAAPGGRPGRGQRPPRTGLLVAAARALGLAQLATAIALLPLSLAWFGQVSVVGSLVNFLAIPAFSFVILPLVLAGALLVVVAPPAGEAVLELAAGAVGVFSAVNAWFAALPFAAVELPPVGPLALGAGVVGAVLALWPRPFAGRWLAPACLLPLLGGGVPRPGPGAFDLTVIDVGQGLAVLVRTARHSLLFDAGPTWRGADAGERAVLPVLGALRVRHLDRLVVSHGDNDHRGGVPAVLARHPRALTLAGDWAAEAIPHRRPCVAGETWSWDGIRFGIVHPDPGATWRRDNDASCVLAVDGPGGSALLAGDIEAQGEAALLASGRLQRADVVVAPHHGSRTSSSPDFVAALRPRFVVFATGYANRWGFPKPDVVERWVAAGSCPLDTALAGAVRFRVAPGHGAALERVERRDARRLWHRPADLPTCAAAPPSRAGAAVYSDAGFSGS
jgi:competence protein ComEC